ncbi:MAG TPA: hypothetical protein PKE45_23385, partial [Caldilineaceae bacterium]|nr:hypothetical protein [Caldilineaceae bacterium]
WPWLAIALFGLVSALGIYAILHGWLTWLLPLFGQLRAPARGLVLWTFAVAVLAALGFELVCRSWPALRRTAAGGPPASGAAPPADGVAALDFILKAGALLLAVVFTPLLYNTLLLTQADPTAFLRTSVAALAITIAAGCWLATWALIAARRAGWIGPSLFALLLIAVLYFDLSAAGAYTDISPSDPTTGFQHDEIVQFLHNEPGRFRIDSDTDSAALWQPDSAALNGLEDIGGVANPLTLRHWRELLAATGGRQSRLYDMLNVHYVIARDGTPLPEGKFELAFDAPGELAVYRNLMAMPRAWLVHQATQVDQAGQVAAIQANDFDPAQRVVVAATAGQLAPATGAEAVTFQESDVNQLSLQVQTTAPAYLVLSEVWYPGWQATVNGAPAELLWANGGLRALYLPAGEGQVELRFAPFSWRLGLGGLAVGLLLLLLLLLTKRKTNR